MLSSVALAVLIAIFGWLVFGGYVLNVTPTWVERPALMPVCWIAFIGSGADVREDTHPGVTFVRKMAPRPLRRALRASAALFSAARAGARIHGYRSAPPRPAADLDKAF